jgi:hypothetical protein
MNASINRLKVIFIGIFFVSVVAIWGYELIWVWPGKDCAKAGGWWDNGKRICALPLYIPNLTGRPVSMSREAWSKLQAERLAHGEISDDPYGPPPKKKVPAPTAKPAATPAPAPVPLKK